MLSIWCYPDARTLLVYHLLLFLEDIVINSFLYPQLMNSPEYSSFKVKDGSSFFATCLPICGFVKRLSSLLTESSYTGKNYLIIMSQEHLILNLLSLSGPFLCIHEGSLKSKSLHLSQTKMNKALPLFRRKKAKAVGRDLISSFNV